MPKIEISILNKGSLKQYPDIGDRPKKALSNPPKDIEPLKRFIQPQTVLSNPHLATEEVLLNPSEWVVRTTDGVLSNFSHGTPSFSGYPFKDFPPQKDMHPLSFIGLGSQDLLVCVCV